MSSTPAEPPGSPQGDGIQADTRALARPETQPTRGGPATDALRAVYVGVGALVVLAGVAIGVFHSSASGATAVIGAFAAPIATLVGAYFGMRTGTDAGAAGKAEAEQRRTESDDRALALAGLMDPSMARSALGALGIAVPGASEVPPSPPAPPTEPPTAEPPGPD